MSSYLKQSLQIIAVAVFLFTFQIASAQTCGEIIIIEDYGDGDIYEERTSVDDCSNPFNADDVAVSNPEVSLSGQTITEGGVVTLELNTDLEVSLSFSVTPFFSRVHFYKKEGESYTRVYQPYYRSGISFAEEGEYVAVIVSELDPPILISKKSFLKKLTSLVIPTAHAYYEDYQEVKTFNFTLIEKVEPPAGASSILFLPGIMGSHLYEESDECLGFGEQRRWFSHTDCEQLRLLTNSSGESINEIYTKPEEDSVVDETLGFNLYKTFLADLADWKEGDIITDYAAVPYDWRLKLSDILKTKQVDDKVVFDQTSSYQDSYIYQRLTDLVANSKSGKVTMVAHSNGGLVVKELLSQMETNDDPLLSQVDNVILVGVPQSGTPESLVSLLHGSKLGPAGVVVSQETTRALLNQSPFAYHLLPSDAYFDTIDSSVVSFELGAITGPWSSSFGNEIKSRNTLESFLTAEGTRLKPSEDDLLNPEIAGEYLLDYSSNAHTVQESWRPVSTTKVYQVAGVGIDTISNITYFTDKKCTKRNFIPFVCDEYAPVLGYRVTEVVDGDGTVLSPSAAAMSEEGGVERLWLDLNARNNDSAVDRVHKDIFEVEDISNFVLNTAQFINGEYNYLQTEAINLPAEDKLVLQLHSPLDMQVITEDGELSSTTESVTGGKYRRHGELQYISLPKNSGPITVILTGVAAGSFTFEVEDWQDGEMVERNQYEGIPSDSGTVVTYEIIAGETEQLLRIDFDGDGVIDGEISLDGTVTDLRPVVIEEVSVAGSGSQSTGTRVRLPVTGQVLGVSTMTDDEQYRAELYRLLTELSRLLDLWNKNLYEKY